MTILHAPRRRSGLRFLASFALLLFLGARCLPTMAQVQSGSKPFATILCRFSDSTSVTPHPPSFYDDLMSNTYPGVDNYYREVSYGNINLAGSKTYGWYNLPHDKAYYLTPDGSTYDFQRVVTDATAVADADVHFPDFYGINICFNEVLPLPLCYGGYGGYGHLTLDGVTKDYGVTYMHLACHNPENFAHEIGHTFGFMHSSGPYSATYDSKWDVMSGGYFFPPTLPTTAVGVHTIAYHMDHAGWIPSNRKYLAARGTASNISMERLALPVNSTNYLMAQIPIPNSNQFYTVEARMKTGGYDAGIPGDCVIIHKVDPSRADRWAQVVDPDNNGDPNDAGAMWTPGETFTDSSNNISVQVLNSSSSGFTVSINNGHVPATASLVSPADNGVLTQQGTFQVSGTDPQGAAMKFRLVISQNGSVLYTFDQTLDNAGWDKASYGNGETATFTLPADKMLRPGTYTWLAYANDGPEWSAATAARSFNVLNYAPDIPTLFTPDAGSVMGVPQGFTLKSSDINGDQIKFRIAVKQGALQVALFDQTVDATGWSKASYASGETATFLIPDNLHIVQGTYTWEASASDGTVFSAVTPPRTFTVQNQPPGMPQVISPTFLASVSPTPSFVIKSTDPDLGDTLKYHLVILKAGQVVFTTDQTVDATGWDKPGYASGEQATFTLPAAQSLSAGEYQWQAFANDGHVSGAPNAMQTMIVRSVPNAPIPVSPEDMASASSAPVFRVTLGTADAGNRLKVKILVKQGSTVAGTFDQTQSATGWDKTDYAAGDTAVFTTQLGQLLSDVTYQWQAFAYDGFQWSPASPSRTLTLASSVPRAVNGLGIFGLGVNMTNPSAQNIGLAGIPVKAWDAATQTYIDVTGPLSPTQGYWFKAVASTPVVLSGIAASSTVSIVLKPGWNLVNTGLINPVTWSVSSIHVLRSGELKTLAQANSAGWIEDAAWVWSQNSGSPLAGQYRLVYDASLLPGVTGSLAPWQGFWIYAYQDCALQLDSTRAEARSRAVRPGGSSWAMHLQASSVTGVSEVLLGELSGGQSLAVGAPPTPPDNASSVQILLRRNGQALAADARTAGDSISGWDVEVHTSNTADSNNTVRLTWPDLATLPRSVELVLTDKQTGIKQFLRSSGGYAFPTSRSVDTYRFHVETIRSGGHLVISQALVRSGRGPSGVFVLSCNISQPAQIQFRVLSNGQAVRTLQGRASTGAGVQEVVWDGRSQAGISLPSGPYTLEIRALGTDGQSVRSVVPLVLVR
jgi:hypothetical protein